MAPPHTVTCFLSFILSGSVLLSKVKSDLGLFIFSGAKKKKKNLENLSPVLHSEEKMMGSNQLQQH